MGDRGYNAHLQLAQSASKGWVRSGIEGRAEFSLATIHILPGVADEVQSDTDQEGSDTVCSGNRETLVEQELFNREGRCHFHSSIRLGSKQPGRIAQACDGCRLKFVVDGRFSCSVCDDLYCLCEGCHTEICGLGNVHSVSLQLSVSCLEALRRAISKEDALSASGSAPTACGEMDETCAVCQDALDGARGRELRRLPCGHPFHSACLAPWLERSNTCPTCRFSPAVAPSPTPDVENRRTSRSTAWATRRSSSLDLSSRRDRHSGPSRAGPTRDPVWSSPPGGPGGVRAREERMDSDGGAGERRGCGSAAAAYMAVTHVMEAAARLCGATRLRSAGGGGALGSESAGGRGGQTEAGVHWSSRPSA
jgi:hypothetical protein